METIKVNMNPNPLDVQTIHASQNDGEARQWEFELHNNGELIDTSDITEQMFFKSYKGGTEQLLPENGSTPTTSPFLGDIRYPQGLLTDQEFTYRESPTQGNGYAKIKSIKGNTLVWNQLVRNGNFADSSRWAVRGSATIDSVASNVLTFTASAQGGGVYSNVSMVQTHKYLYAFEYQSSEQIAFNISGQGSANYDASSSFKRISAITQWSATTGEWQFRILSNATSNFSAIKIKNVMLFDLTQMGIADKSDDEIRQWFSSYYPLPYYDYNAGSLLSFNGTGLKSFSEDESKEDTLTLPVATYFPTGMKSAGTAYDKLTPNKAITKVGIVDLGTIAWGYNTTWSDIPRFYSPVNAIPIQIPNQYVIANIRCVKFKAETAVHVGSSAEYDKCISVNPDGRVYICDSAYTDATAFKTAMNGVYLYYELATPTENSFATASLVTENAEIPLSNEDGVLIGKCTEQLSAEPGFHNAKIKLSDGDGTCYSNKLQLHVERSPQ